MLLEVTRSADGRLWIWLGWDGLECGMWSSPDAKELSRMKGDVALGWLDCLSKTYD